MFWVSSLRNILWGILLGLLGVGVWVYYPYLVDGFQFYGPRVKNNVAAINHSAFSIKEMAPDGVLDPSQPEAVFHETESPERLKTYYAHEESMWSELMKKSMQQKHVDGYPYQECFKASALENALPLALTLGLAAYLSNFDAASQAGHKDGMMHLGWPHPSRELGVRQREDLINDPCGNIMLAGRFLANLLEQSNGEWVPALVAYRDQSSVARPERITREDIAFTARLRRHVEKILDGSFEKQVMYPLIPFDSRDNAEAFAAIVKEISGVDLWIGPKGFSHMVFIPALDMEEKDQKARLIFEMAGIDHPRRIPTNHKE